MNLERNHYFFYGGLFSFSLFFLLFFVILWKSSLEEKTVLFAANLRETISVSFVDTPAITQQEPKTEPEPVEPQKAQEASAQEAKKQDKITQPEEIDDLFSNVAPTKTVKKKHDNSTNLKELSELENKVMSSNRDSKLFEKVNKLDFAKPSVQMVASGSTGPQVNAYYAKVQGIVYANFHPVTGTQGYKARVRIALSREGVLESYKVVAYSSSSIFNAEVDWLKERLRQVGLPPHPQGESAVFEIILSAKD